MTAKEFLEQAYKLDQRINSKMMQIEALRSLATKSTAVIREDPVHGGNNGHRIEDTIIRIVEKEKELDAEIDRLVDLKKEISGVIGQVVDTDLQILLEYRYLCYKKWPEIAGLMHYCRSNILKMHDKALQAVEGILQGNSEFGNGGDGWQDG